MSQQLAADATRSYIMVHIHAAASAANDQDNLFLKNDLFFNFQGTAAPFYRWDGQICNFLVWDFLKTSFTESY